MPNTLTTIFTSTPSNLAVEAQHPNTLAWIPGTQLANGTWQVIHTGVTKTVIGAVNPTVTGRLHSSINTTASVQATGPVLNNVPLAPTGTSALGNATGINVTASTSPNGLANRILASSAITGPFAQIYQGTTSSYQHAIAAGVTQYYQYQYVGSVFYDDSPVTSFSGTATAAPTTANATFTGDATVLLYEPGYASMPATYAANVSNVGEVYTLTSGSGYVDRVKFSLRLVGDGGLSMAISSGDQNVVLGFSLNASETGYINLEGMDHSGGGTTVHKVDAGAFTQIFTAAQTPTSGFVNIERVGGTFTVGFTDTNGVRVGTRATLTTTTTAVVYPFAFLDANTKLVRPAGKGLVV